MRVVGGRLKSRALVAPRGDETRPTSDRVREAWFAVLGDVSGARVLDLYAGTGALAIEALSRGAAAAVCVEASREAARAIEKNRVALDLGASLSVVQRRVERAAGVVHGPFGLILADPPYSELASGALVAALSTLLSIEGLVETGALLTIERAARDAAPEIQGFALEDDRRWGDTAVSFHRAP